MGIFLRMWDITHKLLESVSRLLPLPGSLTLPERNRNGQCGRLLTHSVGGEEVDQEHQVDPHGQREEPWKKIVSGKSSRVSSAPDVGSRGAARGNVGS